MNKEETEIHRLNLVVDGLLKNLKEVVDSFNDLGAGLYYWDETVDKYVWRE